MKISAALRLCVVLELASIAASLILSEALKGALPEPLRNWAQADAAREVTRADILLILHALPLLAAELVALVGLLFLQRWAARLYLVTVVLGFALSPYMGPTVEHALADTAGSLTDVLSGILLALVFFTPVLGEPKPEPPVLPR
jgi:hypothetical protein